MIDLDKYGARFPRKEFEGLEGYDGYNFRLKEVAIKSELEYAAVCAHDERYEEAILTLVDIIETMQRKS